MAEVLAENPVKKRTQNCFLNNIIIMVDVLTENPVKQQTEKRSFRVSRREGCESRVKLSGHSSKNWRANNSYADTSSSNCMYVVGFMWKITFAAVTLDL